MPRIQVRAHHHHLVLLRAARNLANHVKRIFVARGDVGLQVHSQFDGNLLLQQSYHAVILLPGDHESGRHQRVFCVVRSSTLRENQAVGGRETGIENPQRAFVVEKLRAPRQHLLPFIVKLVENSRRQAAHHAALLFGIVGDFQVEHLGKLGDGFGRHGAVAQILVSPARERDLRSGRQLPHPGDQHDPALQLALPGGHVLIQILRQFLRIQRLARAAERRVERFAGGGSPSGVRPGQRRGIQHRVAGLRHLQRILLQRPTSSKRTPFFQMHVLQAVALQPLDRPVGRLAESGRRGEPRAVHIGEVAERLHHSRVFEGLGLDTTNQSEVGAVVLRGGLREKTRGGQQAENAGAHAEIIVETDESGNPCQLFDRRSRRSAAESGSFSGLVGF